VGEPLKWIPSALQFETKQRAEENTMKLVLGIILILVGGLALLIGLVVCVATLTSDYASSACEKAENDRKAFDEAKATCGSTTSECYKQATIGLTTEAECESNTSFMRKQLVMGIVPAVIGALVGFVGVVLVIFGFLGRRKKAVA
jgi:ABC-type antimicrobial peptide transport system permease subunit